MKTTEQQELLLGRLQGIEGVKEVRPYPVHKLLSEEIFKDLPSLKLPAILLSFSEDDRIGKRAETTCGWLAVIVTKDQKGQAQSAMLDLAEDVRTKVTSQQLAVGLHAKDESGLTMIDSGPAYCVGVLNFSTRAY